MGKFKKMSRPLQEMAIRQSGVPKHIYSSGHRLVIGPKLKGAGGGAKNKKNQYISMTAGTSFYSETEAIHQVLQDQMQRANMKPAIEIDPSTVKVEPLKLNPHEKAYLLCRKYRGQDKTWTLSGIYRFYKKRKMDQATIEKVYRIVASLKAATSQK